MIKNNFWSPYIAGEGLGLTLDDLVRNRINIV
jgi:hypothetical protein